ncbi:hypothetical protein OAB74_00175 [Candidatus Pelagibacter sp.]|nr:hypothetical protein [Candidatus Pelagibacter sp.]
MHKSYFYKNKSSNKNKVEKQFTQDFNENKKGLVDINILLNRVKIKERNEKKEKIVFFSFFLLILGLLGAFITIVK